MASLLVDRLVSFRALKYLSFAHSAIYTALLVVALSAGCDDVKYVLRAGRTASAGS